MTWIPTSLRRHLVLAVCRLLEPKRHRPRCVYARSGHRPPPMIVGCACAIRSRRARAVRWVGALVRP